MSDEFCDRRQADTEPECGFTRRSRDILRLIEQTAGVGYWNVDVARQEMFWSPEVFRIHGRAAARGMPTIEEAIEYYHPDDKEQMREHVNSLIKAHTEDFSLEYRVVTDSGATRHVRARGVCQTDPGTNKVASIFGTFQDVTDHETMKEGLLESNQQLENFAKIASHELRAPLRAIANLASWIEEDCEGILPEDARENLFLLKARVVSMKRLIRDILDAALNDGGDIAPSTIFLQAALDEIIEELNIGAGVKIIINCEIPSVFMPPSVFKRIFSNLIGNAVKHNDNKNPEVFISLSDCNGAVAFSVRDNGSGIPSEDADRVFAMFERGLNGQRSDGHGLGLSIVKRLVDSLGGEIRLDPNPAEGAGCVFHGVLPQAKQSNEPPAARLAG